MMSEMSLKWALILREMQVQTKVRKKNCTINEPKIVKFYDSFTNLYKKFFVLSWTLCMAGEQWISGFFSTKISWLLNISQRYEFIFTLQFDISLNSHCLLLASKAVNDPRI